jgi:hypothetical protein
VLKTEQDVLDNRKNAFVDTDDNKVVVSLRDQVQEKLVKKLEDLGEGQRTSELWRQGNNDRRDWLDRQTMLLEQFDEFIDPIYDAPQPWASTLHLPVTYTVCKTYHARMLAALISIDPPFTVKARQSHNMDRAFLIQELMRYTLFAWANNYKGIEDEVDAWLWSWITQGSGVLKSRWSKKYTRFVDVVKRDRVVGTAVVPADGGGLQVIPNTVKEEVEEEVVECVFDGPALKFTPNEDVLIIGGGGDPQEADHVLEQEWMTSSDLWQLADQHVFREEAVREVIKHGDTKETSEPNNAIKEQQTASSGVVFQKTTDHPRYQIIERHTRIDVDESGVFSDVILWVHQQTGTILRATYLRRVMRTGLRPYFKIDFHKRHGQDNGVGLPELMYSLQREIDAVHNMKVDFGLISSMPFGFYRATSSLSTEKMPLEPGVMIPLDNPQADVFFPQLGNRTSFTVQEEQALYQQIERMTTISDMSLGVIGGQGAARTATGARALLGESNANLDVYLRRMNRGWKSAIVYIFHMLQERLPAGFQFRILGDDGSLFWETIKDKTEIEGAFDFELDGNSANSNKQIQIEQANQLLQVLMNPLLMQLGVVGPVNLYNALKTKFQVEGVKDFSKYITKPQGQMRVYSPEEIANATLSGVDIKLGPEQDLQGFLDFFQHIYDHDELLGQFNEQQTVALAKKAQEAQAMLDASQAQAGQAANAAQIQQNAAMTTGAQQAAPPQGMAPQAPATDAG